MANSDTQQPVNPKHAARLQYVLALRRLHRLQLETLNPIKQGDIEVAMNVLNYHAEKEVHDGEFEP